MTWLVDRYDGVVPVNSCISCVCGGEFIPVAAQPWSCTQAGCYNEADFECTEYPACTSGLCLDCYNRKLLV